MIRVLAIALAVLGAGSVHASPVTLDFEEFLEPGEGGRGQPQFESRGFIVDGNEFLGVLDDGYGFFPLAASNGTDALYVLSDYFYNFRPYRQNYVTLTRAGGGEFLFLGMDFAEYWSRNGNAPVFDQNASEIHVRGYRGLNLEFDVSVLVDGIIDGPGGQVDFQSARFMLPAADTVVIIGSGGLNDQAFSLDNILLDTVDNVPAPSAALVLGLGVLLVTCRTRKIPA